jgi:hypothetical protein
MRLLSPFIHVHPFIDGVGLATYDRAGHPGRGRRPARRLEKRKGGFVRKTIVPFLITVGLTALYGTAARATCPTLPNGTFDSDASGWSNFATFDGSDGDPAGSLQVGPVPANNCGDALSDCFPVLAGDQCVATAEGFVPTGQPTDGTTSLGIFFFSDASCATVIGGQSSAGLPSSTQDVWTPLTTGTAIAPAGAHSMRLFYNVCSPAATPLTSNVDNVVSAPAGSGVPALGPAWTVALAVLLAGAGALALGARFRIRGQHTDFP